MGKVKLPKNRKVMTPILTVGVPDKDGNLHTEQAMKEAATVWPEKFKYEEKTKTLWGALTYKNGQLI